MPDPGHEFDMTEKAHRENPESAPAGHGQEETAARMPLSVLPFCEQIAKDAQEEVGKILGRAQLSATSRLDEAEKEAQSVARQIRDTAETQAKRIQARATSGMSLETKRTILRAQGDIIDEVFARVTASLKKLHATKKYIDFLKELTVQAIMVLEEKECLLAPGIEDRGLYIPRLIEEIKELVERATGKKVKLTISTDLLPQGSGVRVYSGAGTTLFDNTLDARMERLQDELRTIVAREVFAPEEAPQSGQSEPGQAQQS